MFSTIEAILFLFVLLLTITLMPTLIVGQSVFDPSTMTDAGCFGTNQWTMWFNSDAPTLTKGDFEVTKNLQQQFSAFMCPSPIAIQTRTVSDGDPSATGDVFKMTVGDGLLCLNQYVIGFKNKQCADYKVRYCCSTSTLGQITRNRRKRLHKD